MNKLNLTSETGLHLVVHNQSDLTLDHSIMIQTGKKTNAAINRVFNYKLRSPYSNCLNSLESKNSYSQVLFGYFEEIYVSNYDQSLCLNFCYQDQLIDNCSCADIKTYRIRNASYCLTKTQTTCMKNLKKIFAQTNLNALCKSGCPEKCDTIEYNLETSFSTYPTLSKLKEFQKKYHSKIPQNVTDAELI